MFLRPGLIFTLLSCALTAAAQTSFLSPTQFVCGVQPLSPLTTHPLPKSLATAGPARTGARSVLVLRIDFANLPGQAVSEGDARAVMADVDRFLQANSFQQLSLTTVAVTPVLRLPGNAGQYSPEGLGQLSEDARAAAAAAGFDFSAYDFAIYSFPYAGFNFSAVGSVGGKGVWIQGNFSAAIVAHELGHNLGVIHANSWFTPDDSILGPGFVGTYGNLFDVMGGSPFFPSCDFNANFRYVIGWLGDADVHSATSNGVYRIFVMDAAQPLDRTKRYALRVPAQAPFDGVPHDYWIDARQAFGYDWTANGVFIKAAHSTRTSQDNLLLDTTPGSINGRLDSPLVLGRTFADTSRRIFITPIKKGSRDEHSYFDVQIFLGVTNNHHPTAILTASEINPSLSQTIHFNAEALDPDGDALSYFWTFDDQSLATKLNDSKVTKAWTKPGRYVVQCTVSDMKGGSVIRSTIVTVGTTTNFFITGQALIGSTPAPAVRVRGQGPDGYRQTYTDSDGFYTLAELPAGAHTITAVKPGFNFPLRVVSVGPGATNIDLLALPQVEPFITTITPSHGEPGSTVTLTGVNFSGTTAVRFGEVSATFTVVSSTKITATVPEGNFTANLSVTTLKGSDTNRQAFTVDVPPPPLITGFAPGHGEPGSTVTISGLNFARATAVRIGGVSAPFTSISQNQITALVPVGASTTVLSITTPNGSATSTEAFGIDLVRPPASPPALTSFAPDRGEPGTAITIEGTNFSGTTSVRFGGINASFHVVSTTQITAMVPKSAFTATLSVTTPEGSIASSNAFVVDPVVPHPFAPSIAGWNPRHGEPGTPVLISGANFAGITAVRFGGLSASFTVLSPAVLSVLVPVGAFTATFSITTTNGTALSSEAFVIDDPQPITLLAQPQNLAVAEGSNGAFAITVSGTGPLGFQWQKDGTNLVGANAPTLTLTNVQLPHEGSYAVTVTNPLDSLTSTSALLTVLTLGRAVEQPALPWRTSPGMPWFGQTNVWLNNGSTGPDGMEESDGEVGTSHNFSAQSAAHTNDTWIETTISGPLLLSFWWQLSARFFDESVEFSIDGVSRANVRGTRGWSQVSLPLEDGPHVLRWTRRANVVGTSAWLAQVRTNAVWFVTQPQSVSVLAGQPANLSAASGGPTSYQWQRRGVLISAATNSTLAFSAVTPAEDGDYQIIISRGAARATSVVARLTAYPLIISQPPTDQIVPATSNATFAVALESRAAVTFQWLFRSKPIPRATNSALKFPALPTNAGPYQVVLSNRYGSVTSSPAALVVRAVPPRIQGASTHYSAYLGENVSLQVPITAVPPPTYRWVRNRRVIRGATGAALSLPRIRLSQKGDYSLIAQNAFGAITQNVHVTVESLVITLQPQSQAVLAGDPLSLVARAGSSLPVRYQWRFNHTDLPGATNASLTIPFARLTDAGNYEVVVRRGRLSVTSSNAAVRITGIPPSFDVEPLDSIHGLDELAFFEAGASGHPAPSYQWFFNFAPLAGFTASSFSIHPVTTAWDGSFYAVANNESGSATSRVARLTVPIAAPRPKLSPHDFSTVLGNCILLRDTENTSPPVTAYQWSFNGLNLVGATNRVLALPAITEAQAGRYRLTVTNELGFGASPNNDVRIRPALALDNWLWNTPRPRAEDIRDATFGQGLFIAVGESGMLLTSTNAVDWQDQSLLTSATLSSIAFAQGRFLVLIHEKEFGPSLLLSSNATDWVATGLPRVQSLDRLHAAQDHFIAAGRDALGQLVLSVSDDGSSWTGTATGLPAADTRLASGAGRSIALTGSQILVSTNGTDWTLGPRLPGARGLSHGPGGFIAVGDRGAVWTSSDGLGWVPRFSGTGKDLFVAGVAGNGFIAAGEDGKIITSPDGSAWMSMTSNISADLNAFAGSPDHLALFGRKGVIVTSPDSQNWTPYWTGPLADLSGVLFTNNLFTAVGDRGTILTSPDGRDWAARSSGTSLDLNALAHGSNGYVAVGANGAILTSTDALLWTARTSGTAHALHHLAYVNGLHVAVGEAGAIVTSANAIQWSAQVVPLPGVNGFLSGVAWGRGLYVAVGGYDTTNQKARSVIVTSPDGAKWTVQPVDFGKKLRHIRFVNNQFIALGNDGLVIRSEDAFLWRQELIAGPLENLRALPSLPGLLAIVGNDGLVFSSPDGEAWQRHRLFTTKNLHDAAYGRGVFVAVGTDGTILRAEGILPALSATPLPAGGGFKFRLMNGARDYYRLQTSHDLFSWRELHLLTNGLPPITDASLTNPCCFFRLQPP